MKRARGFTLIEIMVAILILGIMTALGYAAYRAARISAERTEESLERSKEIEFGVRVIVQDLAQAAPRPVRDILSAGPPNLPAFTGTSGSGTVSPDTSNSLGGISTSGSLLSSSPSLLSSSHSSLGSSSGTFGSGSDSAVTPILSLTRMGWSNTAGQQRGTLQRVSYALVNDTLKRAYQINTDTVQGSKPVVQDLMKGVKGIQFRYLDSNQAWQGAWPSNAPATAVPGATTSLTLEQRPVAVEVVIEFKDWGRIRRLVEVAG